MATQQETYCMRCNRAMADSVRHRYWECEADAECQHVAVASSQYLRHEAVKEIDAGNECFRLRGLPLAEAATTSQLLGPFAEQGSPTFWAATDGSGGVAAQSARLRRCSWAVVFFTPFLDEREQLAPVGDDDIGVRVDLVAGGCIGERQTSYRAELIAVMQAIEMAPTQRVGRATLNIVIDCKSVLVR